MQLHGIICILFFGIELLFSITHLASKIDLRSRLTFSVLSLQLLLPFAQKMMYNRLWQRLKCELKCEYTEKG